jgi:hypothetical protein
MSGRPMDARARLRLQRRLATALLLIGAGLMAMMITTEGEPGLLPLLLVLVGGGWWVVAYVRGRGLR